MLKIEIARKLGLERIPTLQLVLLLLGQPPHQGFIISGPETLGIEQHHVTKNAEPTSDNAPGSDDGGPH